MASGTALASIAGILGVAEALGAERLQAVAVTVARVRMARLRRHAHRYLCLRVIHF